MIETKYNEIHFESADVVSNMKRLINQIWKLIPMRENSEDWKKQINLVIIEIIGLQEVFSNRLNLLKILSELEGLKKYEEIEFFQFRSIVFSIISLMTKENERLV